MARYAWEDGLHQPAMVEGGPQRLVDALVERCQQNGVQFRLGVEIHKVEPGRIETSAGVMEADATLSCRPRWPDWTGPSLEALALGQVLLHVKKWPTRVIEVHAPREMVRHGRCLRARLLLGLQRLNESRQVDRILYLTTGLHRAIVAAY
jgi:glycine/D-amino acid oxidase-like deaminating enzyme